MRKRQKFKKFSWFIFETVKTKFVRSIERANKSTSKWVAEIRSVSCVTHVVFVLNLIYYVIGRIYDFIWRDSTRSPRAEWLNLMKRQSWQILQIELKTSFRSCRVTGRAEVLVDNFVFTVWSGLNRNSIQSNIC